MDQNQGMLELGNARSLDSVEGYEFDVVPIRGYPELKWAGKRPFRSTQFFPAQLREVHGPEVEGWRNKIYWGDNLQVMSHLLRQYRGQVKLAYIDPPFDSKADYKKKIVVRGQTATNDQGAFEDKQYADIWTSDEYLQFIYERLILIRELLRPDGALYIHCDWHRNHHLRCVADQVFAPDNFRNEIIWGYPGREMHIDNKFNAKHDTLLLYARGESTKVNMQAVAIPYNREERIKTLRRKVHVDSDGREWVWETRAQASGQEPYRRYVDDIVEEGKAINDLWTDLQFLRGNDPQRTGYPTQKPESLVERMILASSDPGEIVFDCFMGSGTTQAVAMKLGRRFIGADINLGAVQITTRRLIQVAKELGEKAATDKAQPGLGLSVEAADEVDEEEGETASTAAETTVFYTGFEVYNVNYYDIFRNPVEAKELLMAALEVQPLAAGSVYDGTKDGRMVKVMPVNRIATRADLNDLIANFDYKAFERRYAEHPTQPVEKVMLVCMGHELDLAAALKKEVHPKVLDVEVFDVLRDGQHLQFKRDAEARVRMKDGWLEIAAFYPMNLLGKLSLQKESVEDWRELAESVMVDWNYDGAVLTPAVVDIPEKNGLVVGRYRVPEDAGTIRVKITDLLSESWEGEAR